MVESQEGETVFLRPDLRDTEGWWFYWCFRVRGVADRRLRFVFRGDDPIGVRGPAVSMNGGGTWRWLGRDDTAEGAFSYLFPPGSEEVRFAFTIPYVQEDLDRFLDGLARTPHLRRDVLCSSRKGRSVELLRLGRLDGQCRHRLLVTCRHHACEAMASFVLEGIVEEVLCDSTEGRWLREHVEFLVVPFVDKDGVEDGDQGKNRRPHDHNRDYAGASLYPSVAAIRQLVPTWSQGRLRMALDVHCPWIRGEYNEFVYFPGPSNREHAESLARFSRILESSQTSGLQYSAEDNLPYGQGWNTHQNYTGGKSCAAWCSELLENRLATTIEIPYANANGAEVNAESARAFGRDLARAMPAFLQEEEP